MRSNRPLCSSASPPGQATVFICDADQARRGRLASAVTGGARRVQLVTELSTVATAAATVDRAAVIIGLLSSHADAVFAGVDRIRRANRRIPIIVVATDSSEEIAVAALRSGVNDYFREPVDVAAIAASVERCLAASGERTPAAEIKLIGSSATLRSIEDYLAKVARHDVTVLITGETGTGKELAAARIHNMSARRHARFVSVNCAAIPDGLLESELFGFETGAFTGAGATRSGLLQMADRGTAFLDEVGDMGLNAQAKILRAIETREVYPLGSKKPVPLDLRLVAATNQNLEAAVDEGRFRKDLYFRLNVVRIHLPPLRERRSDIGALLDHYLQALNREPHAAVEGFEDETRDVLEAYDWPGNVRELKNLVEAILVSAPSGRVRVCDLPETFRARLRATTGGAAERRRLLDALLAANWNKSRAASMLHWSRMTVYRKMAKHAVVRSTDPRRRRV